MKQFLITIISLVFISTAYADNEKLIAFDALPTKAQTFVKQNFSNTEVAFSKKEWGFIDTDYEVVFITGDKVEFDKDGDWKQIKCKHSSVPENVIPDAIKQYIEKNHPGTRLLVLERDRYSYEIELSNLWEIKFDKKFNVIDIDFDD